MFYTCYDRCINKKGVSFDAPFLLIQFNRLRCRVVSHSQRNLQLFLSSF